MDVQQMSVRNFRRGYEVVRMLFGLSDDEPKSYDEIAVIMNLSRKAVSRIYHQTLRRMQHYGYHLTKNVTV
jgi:DNA-directed RNA polymerase sigma subunit (sigma70/sigma32)